MKLRNKKTGNVFDVAFHSSYKDGKIVIGVEEDADPKCPKCNFGDYESLEEFCENWEDYKPAEPLIKDEKIRKAVKAWAEANDLDGASYYTSSHHWYLRSFNHREQGIDFWLNLEVVSNFTENKYYTIAELCGEEAE